MISETQNQALYGILKPYERLKPLMIHTPLAPSNILGQKKQGDIYLKLENLQRTGSFKARGAYNKLATLTPDEKKRGVIACSAGNHAQGVALAASLLKINARIFMPESAPKTKILATENYGAKVELVGETFDETKARTLAEVAKSGEVFVSPFDDCAVMQGQGTIGIELLQDLPEVDNIIVPIGGGGLIAGVAVLIKQLMPEIKIIGVEAEDAACLKAALEAGHPVELPRVGLFAEGVAVKRIGDETFRLCQKYVDDVITVDSDAICAAVKDLFEDVRAIAEPSGALALAGLKKYVEEHQIKGERLAHVLSGANVNFHGLRYVSERCELGEKREALFAVTIPEQKGSFLRFCQILGQRVVTEFNYRYSDADPENARIFVGVRLSQGLQERKEIVQQLTEAGYQVSDLSDDEMAKLHVRYMVGGRPNQPLKERLFSFEFPEAPGALMKFLKTLGTYWNITLFHYRSHGTDYGRVLVAFELPETEGRFERHLDALGYEYHDETGNPSFQLFLSPQTASLVVE